METRLVNPHACQYVQSRLVLDPVTVADYAEMLQNEINFEPCQAVITPAGDIIIYDGNHRAAAAKRTAALLEVALTPGTAADAEWLAAGANTRHGLRRSADDIAKAVHTALRHARAQGKSSREIARHCGCDHKTVDKYRKALEASGELPQIDTRTVQRNGTAYQMTIPMPPQPAAPPPNIRCEQCGKDFREDQIVDHDGRKLHTECYYEQLRVKRVKKEPWPPNDTERSFELPKPSHFPADLERGKPYLVEGRKATLTDFYANGFDNLVYVLFEGDAPDAGNEKRFHYTELKPIDETPEQPHGGAGLDALTVLQVMRDKIHNTPADTAAYVAEIEDRGRCCFCNASLPHDKLYGYYNLQGLSYSICRICASKALHDLTHADDPDVIAEAQAKEREYLETVTIHAKDHKEAVPFGVFVSDMTDKDLYDVIKLAKRELTKRHKPQQEGSQANGVKYRWPDGKVLEVKAGIGSGGSYMTMWRKPNKMSWKRFVRPALPVRQTRREAQDDLDAFAQAHALPPAANEEPAEDTDDADTDLDAHAGRRGNAIERDFIGERYGQNRAEIA